jgi:hypothetical protein
VWTWTERSPFKFRGEPSASSKVMWTMSGLPLFSVPESFFIALWWYEESRSVHLGDFPLFLQ